MTFQSDILKVQQQAIVDFCLYKQNPNMNMPVGLDAMIEKGFSIQTQTRACTKITDVDAFRHRVKEALTNELFDDKYHQFVKLKVEIKEFVEAQRSFQLLVVTTGAEKHIRAYVRFNPVTESLPYALIDFLTFGDFSIYNVINQLPELY